jgi:UDP-N-acetyl-D-galactosamine dehydrogenase
MKVSLYTKIKKGEEAISIVGLGYVGLPLAVEFAKKVKVIAFDIDRNKIECYRNGMDLTKEVGDDELKLTQAYFTCNELELRKARFHISAVATPINRDKTPNLKPIISASEIIGRNLSKESIVVYESTVYPGVTEEVCVPVLEQFSGLVCGRDFKVGYSPERINPGDREHTLTKIIKVVSGMDEESLEEIANIYGLIIEAGIYKAESIKVAEAAKVIENCQRDINIAFMNELAVIFNRLGIDTCSVLETAKTKWNFLDFRPGLVGGHCIGVDPYYLTYKAEQAGYYPQIILAGRRINDSMGKYIAENTVKHLIKADKNIKGSKVLIMGFSFKENVNDVRNTRVMDIVKELREYGIEVHISDPVADRSEALKEFGINIEEMSNVNNLDAIVLAVPHMAYRNIDLDELKSKYRDNRYILIDVKRLYSSKVAKDAGYIYWGL